MNRIPHALIGAAVGYAWGVTVSEPLIGVAVSALGACLPDVDQYWATRVKPRSGAACGWREHRGPTHSLLIAALLYALMPPLGVGYCSHLVADGLTYMGVPYLWPLNWRRLRLLPRGLRLRSGAWTDWLVVGATVAAVCAHAAL